MTQREIKFRAWDKKNNRMMFNVGFSFSDCGMAIIRERMMVDDEVELYRFPEEIELLQFTGLKDKNGKEIYEGDIVRFYACQDEKGGVWISLYQDYREWIGIVEFLDGEYVVSQNKYIKKAPKELWQDIEKNMANRNWEVIGNIYENPELINPQKMKNKKVKKEKIIQIFNIEGIVVGLTTEGKLYTISMGWEKDKKTDVMGFNNKIKLIPIDVEPLKR